VPIAGDLDDDEADRVVAGYMVEYGSTPYMMLTMGEYVAITSMCAMATILFLGGWLPPVGIAPFTWVPAPIWFLLKTGFMMFCILWVRATFPRFRYDQIMRLGWKMMLPVSLVNVALTAAVFLWGGREALAWMGIIEWIAIVAFVTLQHRSPEPEHAAHH